MRLGDLPPTSSCGDSRQGFLYDIPRRVRFEKDFLPAFQVPNHAIGFQVGEVNMCSGVFNGFDLIFSFPISDEVVHEPDFLSGHSSIVSLD
jgi:hypothetical protein